jgi:hypothetical protein
MTPSKKDLLLRTKPMILDIELTPFHSFWFRVIQCFAYVHKNVVLPNAIFTPKLRNNKAMELIIA